MTNSNVGPLRSRTSALTGAAPIPQRSVAVAVRQYWDHVGSVHGRRMEVFLRDDRYNPSHATQVCNELIQRQQVFILNGVGGADQIAACARTAAQQGVPYFSSGTVHAVLESVRTYFAFSMSYKQQAALVVQEIQRNARPSNNRVAILRDRTPSFNEAVEEVQRLLEQAGFDVLLRQHQNGPSDAQWLVANQVETAFPIMAPSAWVQIVNSPGGSIRHWVGMGPTMGLNSVANAACPAIDGARFFSPWSGLNVADELDPEWERAGRGDDIQWAAWTGYRGIHAVFELMGADGLTRESFVHVLERVLVAMTASYPVSPESMPPLDCTVGSYRLRFGRSPADLTKLILICMVAGFCTNAAITGMYAIFAKAFPTHVRATGSGVSYNVGRFATAAGVLTAGFLYQLTGERPDAGTARALDAYFIVGAEHSFNASTFTARVIISTRSDIASAVAGAIGTMKGPLHGGAPSEVVDQLSQVGSVEHAEQWVRDALARGERLMGFGHRVYRAYDPRAAALRKVAEGMEHKPDWLQMAIEVEDVALRILAEKHPERPLRTNVEYYAAPVLMGVGLSPDLFPATFSLARHAGWTAHVLEQSANNRLIRPDVNYVGPEERDLPG